MGIVDSLLKFLKFKKKVVHIELSPESVREHNTIRALANENAELKGEMARLKAEIGAERESEKDKKEEEEVRLELNKQKKEIKKKVYPKYFSLKAFFKILNYKKFRDKVGLYSFDRSQKLARFGDFGFSSDGDFVILDDKNNVVLKMKTLRDIFQSVGGLGHDVVSNKIPLNLDKEGGYVENIMVWEAPDITPTVDGNFKYTKAKKRPLYEYLNELREEIMDKNNEIEELELTNTKLQRGYDDLKIAQRVAENSAMTAKKELSLVEKEHSATVEIFRSTAKELSQVRNANIITEDNVDMLEEQVKALRDIAEREGVTPSFEDALAKIDAIKETLRQKTIIPPQPKEEKEVAKS